jgi:cyclophilin family peptidyl-prolyl cis-trans isomerase
MTVSFARSAFVVALTALTLVACGGGGSTSVANIAASNARFGQNMVVTFNGQGLDREDLEARVDGPCSPPTRVPGGTANTLQFTCFVGALGQIQPYLVDTRDNVVLGSVKVDIPLPRIALTVSDGARSGVIELELDPVSAPHSTSQFLAYANAGFYTATVFHQVSPDSTIGGGAYTVDSAGALVKKEPNRAAVAFERTGLKNLRGTIALYRGAAPNSANAQFFINVVDNPRFDGSGADAADGFAVFGKVISGLDVVDVVAKVPVRPDLVHGFVDVPLTAVRLSAVAQTR